MNFYDVLFAEKLGGGVPTIKFFDLLFAQSMGGGEQWQTYEGTLPAAFNANGDDMKQYQVYGDTGGVGDDSGTAYGYEVSIGVKSGNLLDYSTVQSNLTVDAVTGLPSAYNGRIATLAPIDVSTVSAVTITYNSNYSGILFIYSVLMADNTMLIRKTNKRNGDTIEIPSGGIKLYISWYGTFSITTDDITQVMVSANPSDKYQPYFSTVTPIYIGSAPLDKDEYIDYQAGKIYRMINGTLTPTDPPVPLPALPTCEGETVVDYAGQSVAPEKVLLEYKKGGN